MTTQQEPDEVLVVKERILLVGEDSALLAMRALLLSQWQTSIAAPSEALELLKTETFDGVVLCHALDTDAAKQIVSHTAAIQPRPAILAIRVDGDPEIPDVEHHARDLWESPAWLSSKMASFFSQRESVHEAVSN